MRAPQCTDWSQFSRPESERDRRILIRDVVDRPTVYRLTGWWERDLLYIGVTKNIGARLAGHRRVQPWWPEVAAVSCEYFLTMPAAMAAEAEAIRSESPRYNISLAR